MAIAISDLPRTDAFVLRNCSVPRIFLSDGSCAEEGDILVRDIHVAGSEISAVTRPDETPEGEAQGPAVDVARAMIWPCFADLHCHLDKNHTSDRAPAGDGTLASALEALLSDKAHWHGEETRLRMDFGLRCAFAHGTSAIRTHLDSDHPSARSSWEVFGELRDGWAGRIDLQAVSLVQVGALADPVLARVVADRVAEFGGILGASTRPVPNLEAIVENLFELAEERDLALDFHVDESCDPGATALSLIAQTAIRRRFPGRIVVGHCSSLAVQEEEQVDRTLDLVAEAGLAVVALPVLNLQLQDRQRGRTPRWRGVTLVHEMRERGIPVAIGGDNVRDPLHPYGDYDMLAIYRDATRIGHLDTPVGTWPLSVTSTPRDIMELPERRIGAGYSADFVLFSARTYSELLARPQSDRIVVRNGRPSAARLPDFAELDAIMPLAGERA